VLTELAREFMHAARQVEEREIFEKWTDSMRVFGNTTAPCWTMYRGNSWRAQATARRAGPSAGRAQDRSRAPWWPSGCPNAVTQHAGSLEAIMRELLISEFQDRRTTLSL
jgi:hypothetical protein